MRKTLTIIISYTVSPRDACWRDFNRKEIKRGIEVSIDNKFIPIVRRLLDRDTAHYNPKSVCLDKIIYSFDESYLLSKYSSKLISDVEYKSLLFLTDLNRDNAIKLCHVNGVDDTEENIASALAFEGLFVHGIVDDGRKCLCLFDYVEFILNY